MPRGRPPNPNSPLNVTLAPDIKVALNEAAKEARVSLSDFVAVVLNGIGQSKNEFLDAYGNEMLRPARLDPLHER